MNTASDGPVFLPTRNLYQQLQYRDASTPTQAEIEGVDPSEHSTYETHIYYAFIEDKSTKKRYIVSDNGLKAELTFVPGSFTKNSYGLLGSSYSVALPDQSTGVTLSINGDRQDRPGFSVTGTPEDHPLLPPLHAPDGYRVIKRKPDNTTNKQIFDDVFVHKTFAFEYMQMAWNITKMNMDDFQKSTGSNKYLFALPGGNSKNFSQVSGATVPYGWFYKTQSAGSGTETTSLNSSSSDVMVGSMKATGFNVGGGIDVSVPGIVDIHSEFSVTRNKAVTGKIQNIYENEMTITVHKYIETEFVFMLDKANVHLFGKAEGSDSFGFLDAVRELHISRQEAPGGVLSQEQLEEFFDNWGTHYAYAATFGAKGSSENVFDKKTRSNLIESKIDMSKAWSASVSVKVFGQGGNVKGGQESQDAKENLDKFGAVDAKGFTKFSCVGGGTCDMGKPPAGNRVPILLDLRPITDLLGPPFFTDVDTAITLRAQVATALATYVFEHPNRTGDTFPKPTTRVHFDKVAIDPGKEYFANINYPSYETYVKDVKVSGPEFALAKGTGAGKGGKTEYIADMTADHFTVPTDGGGWVDVYNSETIIPSSFAIMLSAEFLKYNLPASGGGPFDSPALPVLVDKKLKGSRFTLWFDLDVADEGPHQTEVFRKDGIPPFGAQSEKIFSASIEYTVQKFEDPRVWFEGKWGR